MAVPAAVRSPALALASALFIATVPAVADDEDARRVDAVALARQLGPNAAPRADAIVRFYQARDYRPAWTKDDHLSRAGAAAVRALRAAEREGLPGSRYVDPAFDVKHAPDQAALGAIDVRLTDSLLRYVSDLTEGRIDPAAVNPYWAQRTPAVDAVLVLRGVAESKDVGRALDDLLPKSPQYAALRDALARYRAIAEGGGWAALKPLRLPLRPGQRGPATAALRARLLAEGDLRGSVPGGARAELFDDALAAAVKRFQARHGLEATGVVERQTLAALNVPVEDRIAALELNLERWRWLWPSLRGADRLVLVNIPAFELHGLDHGRPALRMRVVTGNAARSPTPVFSREMTEVIFRPYWNVPTSIAQDEILPVVYRDRGYLRRRNMELVRGDGGVQLRQRPGPGNALGLVKFLLPNPFGVYLHDTPEDALFARARRDKSHGCVRVERPFDLARFALQDAPEWTPARIQAAAARGPERPVPLEEPLPVFITYLTAWADPDLGARFFPDVYEHDAAQIKLLQ